MQEIDAIIAISDVASFSQFTPNITPVQLVESLNGYLKLTCGLVAESGGEVVSYIGDSAICLWAASAKANRQAQIGAGLVKLHKSACQFTMPDGMRITQRLAVTFGRMARTDHECGGERQALPLFGPCVNFVRRLNASHIHFKKNFLASDNLPVIWPREVELHKLNEITVKGTDGTRAIFSVEDVAT